MKPETRKFKLSEIADLHNVPVTRLRTMRARGQSGTWDAGVGETADDYGKGWRTYSLTDAVAVGCVIELIERGVAADVSGSIVENCRGWIGHAHPGTASSDDVWIGALSLKRGRAHVGGPLPAVLADVQRHDSNGGGSALILVNASNHHRRLVEKLANGN